MDLYFIGLLDPDPTDPTFPHYCKEDTKDARFRAFYVFYGGFRKFDLIKRLIDSGKIG
jgi:hypothetical protein